MEDSLGDRMKFLEKMGEANLIPLLPVMSRLDGKSFHTFTKGLERPYDKNLSELMVATTKYLVEETNAKMGYTQSDEISLVFYSNDMKSEIFMGGRSSKMISILSAMATAFFNNNLINFLPNKVGVGSMPLFDCRVWNVPTKTEAVNCLIWRELDSTRNSIQMAGQSVFSHKELMNKSCDNIQEMLFQVHNINWNDYPAWAKRGTYVQRREISKPFTSEEIEKLPPLHNARKNPDLITVRHEVGIIDMPIFTTIVNREGVIFDGEEPITKKE